MATAARAVAVATSNRFDPEQQQLSPVEKTALDYIRECIRTKSRVTQLGIMHAIGSQNTTGGTSAGVLKRLEDKGYITRTFYQRGLQVCDAETGECSIPPTCRTTHWRKRKEDCPTPPIHIVRNRAPNLAGLVEAEARKSGMALQDFLMDLVYNGLELWLETQEAGA